MNTLIYVVPDTPGSLLSVSLSEQTFLNYVVTLNSKNVTEIINKLPDNLNGPVLPCRMISL